MTIPTLLLLPVLASCAVDSAATPDLEPDCDGEGFVLEGAFTARSPSASTVTVGGAIVGIGGFGPQATSSYSFVLRDAIDDEIATVGTYDVAAHHLAYLRAPATANCHTPDQCEGFVATIGTLEVVSLVPLVATFELSGLEEHDGAPASVDLPSAGTVRGCLRSAD